MAPKNTAPSLQGPSTDYNLTLPVANSAVSVITTGIPGKSIVVGGIRCSVDAVLTFNSGLSGSRVVSVKAGSYSRVFYATSPGQSLTVSANKVVTDLGLSVWMVGSARGRGSYQDDGTLISNGSGGYFRNFPQLYRGINLFNMFMGPDIYTTNWQTNYISAQGLTNLKLWGFKHVRIPIDINFLCDPTQSTPTLNSARMASLDAVISNAVSAGLAVVLGLWPETDAYRVATNTASHSSYASFWSQVVNRYKNAYGAEQIFFEILNEPHFHIFQSDATARSNWANYRTTVINAIRAESTAHWLIIPDYTWNTVQNVIDYNTVIADTKIIYTAHYYEFIAFTYQGMAEIGDPLVEALHNLPYPMRQPEFNNCMATLTSQQQADMAWYASTNFGYSTTLSTMTGFRNWSKANSVPIYLGEFGTGRAHSIPGDAETWLKDVRRAAEANNIPHANWSYTGDFNLMQSLGGNPVASVLSALMDP